MSLTRRAGRVASFDAQVGLGEVCAEDGTRYPFHCAQIADGSRDIAAGAEVTFVVRPGLPGVWEAYELSPAAAP